MSNNGKLYFLPADGPAIEILPEAYGELSYGAPSFDFMRPRIKCDVIEHVSVRYQGKEAHLFCDEESLLKDDGLVPNDRATALTANAQLDRHPQGRVLAYHDVTKPPPTIAANYWFNTRALIVGNAFLWTGDME